MRIDPFFDRQPPTDFIDELKKPLFTVKPPHFGARAPEADEIDLRGLFLDADFPDPEGLLETAYADFRRFAEVYEIAGVCCPVRVRFAPTDQFEAYSVTVSADGVLITAADTEGIRRALVYLEDLIIESEQACLRPLSVSRRPVIRSRITRCFFSPTNRPPHNIDELYDDVDYYPDEYLNRIAHDGNNGIWIYTRFPVLLSSSVISEYGEGSERRLEKLRQVVKKCARYGIKVYVFAVEPCSIDPAFADKYEDIRGVVGWGGSHTFCSRSERGREYIIDATQRLFTAVPDLGGYIDITAGERVTSCASMEAWKKCPRCGKYTRGENLAYTVDLIREGMRRAGAKGEFISWTYGHRAWEREDIRDYVRRAPDDVMLMQNFDDMGRADQLGRERLGVDYWLSYTGPSDLFTDTAEEANRCGKHLYAKMQVCCSHELATVPYIPAPGLVFDKYAGARRYSVEGILQCWYFGNYPSIMSKAAGEVSFMEDFGDKRGFLRRLAGICFGRSCANAVADAWETFGEAYSQYPLNIMFSYYGPMHDGVVWELALEPKNRPLSRTWLLLDKPDGDRIGESLQAGHTLEEAIILAERMRNGWKRGLALLPHERVGEMSTLSRALGVLFDSGANILHFYALREKLGYRRGDASVTLSEMRALVQAEIENSLAMEKICLADNRLGYHSEAEGFKFFPEKLRHRADQLRILLETEFPAVEARIAAGKAPLAYYIAEGEDGYRISRTGIAGAPWEPVGERSAFRAAADAENFTLDVQCAPGETVSPSLEFRLMWPCPHVTVSGGKAHVTETTAMYGPVYDEPARAAEEAKYNVTVTDSGMRIVMRRADFGWNEDTPIRMRLKVGGDLWKREAEPTYTLGKAPLSPGEYGWLI